MKYRKKPIEVDAVQWTGKNSYEIKEFTLGNSHISALSVYRPQGQLPEDFQLFINTLEGTMTVNIGDYIIKGVEGEFYPVRENIFNKTYERIKDNE